MSARAEVIAGLQQRIRERLDELSLDMKSASLAAGMNETFVRDILRRARMPRMDAMLRLADVLKADPKWLIGSAIIWTPPEEAKHKPNASPPVPIEYPTERIPIFGSAVAGEDGQFVLNGQRIMDALCPPQLVGVPNAYGVLVHSTSMVPRYFPGEGVFVNPHLPVLKDDFVIVQIAAEIEGDDALGFVKQFVRLNSRELVLHQYQPREGIPEDAAEDERFTMRFPRERVIAVHKIVSSGIV